MKNVFRTYGHHISIDEYNTPQDFQLIRMKLQYWTSCEVSNTTTLWEGEDACHEVSGLHASWIKRMIGFHRLPMRRKTRKTYWAIDCFGLFSVPEYHHGRLGTSWALRMWWISITGAVIWTSCQHWHLRWMLTVSQDSSWWQTEKAWVPLWSALYSTTAILDNIQREVYILWYFWSFWLSWLRRQPLRRIREKFGERRSRAELEAQSQICTSIIKHQWFWFFRVSFMNILHEYSCMRSPNCSHNLVDKFTGKVKPPPVSFRSDEEYKEDLAM